MYARRPGWSSVVSDWTPPLADHVTELDRLTAELEDSRWRLHQTRGDELARMEQDLRAGVVPRLEMLADRLDEFVDEIPDLRSPSWPDVLAEIDGTLAHLRAISHGLRVTGDR